MEPIVGQEYPSFQEAKVVIRRWLQEEGLSYKRSKGDPWVIICKAQKSANCDFRIRVNRQKEGGVKLTVLQPHTCPVSTHLRSHLTGSVTLLAEDRYIQDLIANRTQKTKPADVREHEELRRGNRINYNQSWRTIQAVQRRRFGSEDQSFKRIPALLSAMEGKQSRGLQREGLQGAYTCLQTKGDRFRRCWIMPYSMEKAFVHCRNFIAMDGCHTRTTYKLVLLMVSTIDGNNETLPLAWAFVDREDEANWTWFLRGISQHLQGMEEDDAVCISDRQKGLIPALRKTFPRAAHAHCNQHIAENIRRRFGKRENVLLFWRAARAKTEADFEGILAQMPLETVTYLREISPAKFAVWAFPRPRYRHDTSNIAESINSHIGEARDLPVFNAIIWLWDWVMGKVFSRSRRQQKTTRITNFALDYLKVNQALQTNWQFHESDNGVGTVVTRFARNTVDLNKKMCTCGEFQDRQMPCKHALALCKEQYLEREDYVSKIYSMNAYRKTYGLPLPSIMADNLPKDEACQAPPKLRAIGRPRTARIRSKTGAKIYFCSICGSRNHNRRRCGKLPLTDSESEKYRESAASDSSESIAPDGEIEEAVQTQILRDIAETEEQARLEDDSPDENLFNEDFPSDENDLPQLESLLKTPPRRDPSLLQVSLSVRSKDKERSWKSETSSQSSFTFEASSGSELSDVSSGITYYGISLCHFSSELDREVRADEKQRRKEFYAEKARRRSARRQAKRVEKQTAEEDRLARESVLADDSEEEMFLDLSYRLAFSAEPDLEEGLINLQASQQDGFGSVQWENQIQVVFRRWARDPIEAAADALHRRRTYARSVRERLSDEEWTALFGPPKPVKGRPPTPPPDQPKSIFPHKWPHPEYDKALAAWNAAHSALEKAERKRAAAAVDKGRLWWIERTGARTGNQGKEKGKETGKGVESRAKRTHPIVEQGEQDEGEQGEDEQGEDEQADVFLLTERQFTRGGREIKPSAKKAATAIVEAAAAAAAVAKATKAKRPRGKTIEALARSQGKKKR
jgi:hypothetical protein